ncbi:MAG: hypothetical protein Q6373_026070 [Candidatus Sigynarchaeota archaeon]
MKTTNSNFVNGSLVLTSKALVFYDKEVEDICPLVAVASVDLIKRSSIFIITLKNGGKKQYWTHDAITWAAEIESLIDERKIRYAAPPDL